MMGFYINPDGESKELFLMREGINCLPKLPEDDTLGLVCLVRNPAFTAAAVCYNERELEAFTQPTDMRSKKWFLVAKEKLVSVVQPDLKSVWT